MIIAAIRRFTLDEYNHLAELGFFGEDDRIELICGQIIQMAAKGIAHKVCITKLNRELLKILGDGSADAKGVRATLRIQSPIVLLTNSEPEPDFTIVQNRFDDYLSTHPGSADVLLVIEIADSSLDYDQKVKLPLYAEVGIYYYWIFNLAEQRLETYSEPLQDLQGKFDYAAKRVLLLNKTVALPCFPELSLDLAKVFPKITA